MLGSYYFGDSLVSSGFLSVQGSWLSDTELGTPVQTSHIICMKDYMLCTEAIAQISDISGPFLSVSNELYDIDVWNNTEILTKPKDFACVRYITRFDLIQKQVTQTRTTLSMEGMCQGTDKEPIHFHLGNGLKIQQKSNK